MKTTLKSIIIALQIFCGPLLFSTEVKPADLIEVRSGVYQSAKGIESFLENRLGLSTYHTRWKSMAFESGLISDPIIKSHSDLIDKYELFVLSNSRLSQTISSREESSTSAGWDATATVESGGDVYLSGLSPSAKWFAKMAISGTLKACVSNLKSETQNTITEWGVLSQEMASEKIRLKNDILQSIDELRKWSSQVKASAIQPGRDNMNNDGSNANQNKNATETDNAPSVFITFPTNKARLRGGDRYTITWETSKFTKDKKLVTILFKNDVKDKEYKVVTKDIADTGRYEWSVPLEMTTSGVLRIQISSDSSGSAAHEASRILIDSVKPTRKIIGTEQLNASSVNVFLELKDEGPAGLASGQLWYRDSSEETWMPGPFIQDPRCVNWKAPSPGTYLLDVVLSDASGNISAVPSNGSKGKYLVKVK